MHRRFEIANDDFLYVLSTMVFEPIRWNERFGWRPLVENERLATFHFWREVGRRMAITDIPEDFAEFERYNVEYERARFRYAESNQRVSEATRDMFLAWFPGAPEGTRRARDRVAARRPAARGDRLPAAAAPRHAWSRGSAARARPCRAAAAAAATPEAAHATPAPLVPGRLRAGCPGDYAAGRSLTPPAARRAPHEGERRRRGSRDSAARQSGRAREEPLATRQADPRCESLVDRCSFARRRTGPASVRAHLRRRIGRQTL